MLFPRTGRIAHPPEPNARPISPHYASMLFPSTMRVAYPPATHAQPICPHHARSLSPSTTCAGAGAGGTTTSADSSHGSLNRPPLNEQYHLPQYFGVALFFGLENLPLCSLGRQTKRRAASPSHQGDSGRRGEVYDGHYRTLAVDLCDVLLDQQKGREESARKLKSKNGLQVARGIAPRIFQF